MSRNPFARILLGCAGIAVVALIPWPWGPTLGLAGVSAAAVGAGASRPTARRGLLAAGLTVVFGVLLRVLQGELTVVHAVSLLTVAVAVGVSTAIAALVTLVTDPRDVGLDLERRGVPRSMAFAVVGLAGAPGVLGRRRSRIVEAQLARGVRLDRGLIGRLRATPAVVVPLVVASLHDLADRTLARESRGISQPGRRTLLDVPPETAIDQLLEIGGALVIGALLAARLTGFI